MTDPNTTPRSYMDLITEDPNGFLRTTEVWCVRKPMEGKAEDSVVMRYNDPGLTTDYPANASFISKVVLTKGPGGVKIMFMAATGLHDPIHLMDVLRAMDFERIKWTAGHAKAEFAAPPVQKYGYIIKVHPDVTDSQGKIIKRGDTEAVVLAPTNLVDTEGKMIMMNTREHDGVQPDWVYNWSFVSSKTGVHVVALTGNGKLLEQITDRTGNRRYRDITPKGTFVNDVVTIPKPDGQVEFILATSSGVMHKGNPVIGTGSHHVCNLCYDNEAGHLWIRTKDNKVFRMHPENIRASTPEPWSNVPMVFQEAVSHKLLCGAGVPAPILTAWTRPREIMRKDPVTEEQTGTGRFLVGYLRMEIARMIHTHDNNQGDSIQSDIC